MWQKQHPRHAVAAMRGMRGCRQGHEGREGKGREGLWAGLGWAGALGLPSPGALLPSPSSSLLVVLATYLTCLPTQV